MNPIKKNVKTPEGQVEYRKKTILLADDSETFVMCTSIIIKRMGYNVIAAKNGEEVLAILKAISPDVVLLDVKMPVMDGLTTLKHLKKNKNFSHIPVVMFTIYPDKSLSQKLKELDCFGFLEKPIKILEMNKILQECIIYPGGKKRRYLRTPLQKRVNVSINGIAQDYYAENLSERGIYIRKSHCPPLGTMVDIVLDIPGKKSLFLEGVVIYKRDVYKDIFIGFPGMAIEFKEINSEDSQILKEYILEQLSCDVIGSQKEVKDLIIT